MAETAVLEELDFFVGGERRPSRDGARFDSVDPATGAPWARVAGGVGRRRGRVRAAAPTAFEGPWRSLPASERGLLLFRLADAIEANAERIGSLETRDNGKLYREMAGPAPARAEVDPLLRRDGRQDRGRDDPARPAPSVLNYTVREPLGVVAVDHAVELARVPDDHAAGARAGRGQHRGRQAVGGHVGVDARAWRGSPTRSASRPACSTSSPGSGDAGRGARRAPAGRPRSRSPAGWRRAGRWGRPAAERFTPVTLELGGKSANIVFEDANLEAAESGVLAGIFAAAGQTCVAGSRAFVHESVYDELAERLDRARARRSASATRWTHETADGPDRHARRSSRRSPGFVERARAEGGEIVAGGRPRRGRPGARGRLLLAADDRARTPAPDSHLAQNEVFGPVLALFPFSSEEEVRRRPPTAPGTGSPPACGPGRQPRAPRRAGRLEAGTVWVEHVPRDGAAVAVRRIQGERHRAAERGRCDPRVRADEEHLGRALRRGPGPVRAASLGSWCIDVIRPGLQTTIQDGRAARAPVARHPAGGRPGLQLVRHRQPAGRQRAAAAAAHRRATRAARGWRCWPRG